MGFLSRNKEFYEKRSQELSQQQSKWDIEKQNLQKENTIKQQYKELTKKDKKITTGKLVLWLFLILVICIIVFIGWATVAEVGIAMAIGQIPSFAPLTTLAGTILSTALVILGYFYKSSKENSEGGITFEKAKANDFNIETNDLADKQVEDIQTDSAPEEEQ